MKAKNTIFVEVNYAKDEWFQEKACCKFNCVHDYI